MLVIWFATGILAITVASLIRAEFRADKKQIYTFKPISSTLLLLIGIVPVLIGRDLSVNYSLWIVVGLLFSLGGDIALMFHDSPKAFRIGLVLFLMAHLMYCVAFSWQANMVRQEIQVIIILGILAAVVYRYLYPGLGSLKFSVLVYIIVISYMLNRAFATRLSPNFSRLQSGLVCVGAGLFYISDLMLAINRFRLPFRYHRISLAFYYGGQLLIALSTIT